MSYVYINKNLGDSLWDDAIDWVLGKQNTTSQIETPSGNTTSQITTPSHNRLFPLSPSTYYIVKSGDTLSKIAAKHGVSLVELMRWNGDIKNPDLIYPGQRINIPPLGGSPQTPYGANLQKQDTTKKNTALMLPKDAKPPSRIPLIIGGVVGVVLLVGLFYLLGKKK